jgi:translation initiation factor eIF-2B subunit epsilon
MTVVYKKIAPGQRTGNEILIATDKGTSRLLFYQRLSTIKEQKFKFPIDIFLNNQEVELHHDLMDPQISICSVTALPLFSDNFDYETRDQFIRGLVMGQELEIGSIYVAQLPNEQYAAKVSDWMAYHEISQDIINRWAYPLVPDMGICTLRQQYLFLKNNIYRNSATKIGRNCNLTSDVVLQSGCEIGDRSTLKNCVLGNNCKIGANCNIKNSYIFDDTIIGDDCKLENSIIGANVLIERGSNISSGSVISNDCKIEKDSSLSGWLVQNCVPQQDDYSSDEFERIGEKAYKLIEGKKSHLADESEEDIDELDEENFIKLQPQTPNYDSSAYSSGSENEDEENEMQAPLEDADQFLVEVVESIKRGFNEKSNADFLILEINGSRYTYNIPFNEVNFLVVKASLSLPIVVENNDPLKGFEELYKYLGEKVLKNYIKDEEAMHDCLSAIIESCEDNEKLKPYVVKIMLFLYNEDVLTEDAILTWYDNVEQEWVKKSLKKFIEWLEQESEDESDD